MPCMTNCERGTLVLVRFVFADERGAKQRPVLVLSTTSYHRGRQEVVVAAVTSNGERFLVGDYRVRAWRRAGLPRPSVVTGIIRTIKQQMILKTLGTLSTADLHAVEGRVRRSLGL
jgi:mRNA-degrading endonuclease toxin of MazEF toxin-antitoxin module